MSESMALTYRGDRAPGGQDRTRVVCVHSGGRSEPLDHVVHHSRDGFEWGYAGSGPAELALSLLADVLGDREQLRAWLKGRNAGAPVPQSWTLHQDFKRDHVMRFEHDSWELHRATIEAWCVAKQVAAMRNGAERAGVDL